MGPPVGPRRGRLRWRMTCDEDEEETRWARWAGAGPVGPCGIQSWDSRRPGVDEEVAGEQVVMCPVLIL